MPDAINHQDSVLNCPGSLAVEKRAGSGEASKLQPSDFPPGCFGLGEMHRSDGAAASARRARPGH
eukprot:14391152-Alexandrium_andersonii.AAC.1